jgi:diguanylate cyclase (GGDEF)-like protein/PAS domain S-box-containing protein
VIDAIQSLWVSFPSEEIYLGQYDATLVALSVMVALGAAFAALSAFARGASAQGRVPRLIWTVSAGLILGLGVWAMHFIGMLALNLPCGVSYDPGLTLLSMVPGMLAGVAALALINRQPFGRWHMLLCSLLLGGGIGAMHYSGMLAMRLEGTVVYNPALVLLSVAVAVALAYLALRVLATTRCATWRCQALCAVALGAAACVMHYCAMSAAYFVRVPVATAPHSNWSANSLAWLIAAAAVAVTLLTVALSVYSRYQNVTRQLRESEQRWRFALEGGGDGVWDLDVAIGEAVLSPAGKLLFGFGDAEPAQYVSQWLDRVHTDDRERVAQEWVGFLRSGSRFYASEYRVRGPQRQLTWLLVQGMVVSRDQTGRVQRIIGTVRNVTEHRLSQERDQRHSLVFGLLAAKAPLDQVLQHIVDALEASAPGRRCAIFLFDDAGENLLVGASLALVGPEGHAIAHLSPAPLGCGPAAYLGRRIELPSIDQQTVGDALPPWMMALGLKSCWSQPIFWASGRLMGALDIYHSDGATSSAADEQWMADEARMVALVVERTQAEAKLQLAANVFTHAREGIMITDVNSNIVEVNDTFTRITGYTREEALGANPRMLSSGRQDPQYYAEMWSQINSEGQWTGELWNRRKNGDVFAELCTVSVVRDARGQIQNYLAMFSDITPLKAQQEQLERLAHYDALTHLPNRVLLADRLRQAMAHCARAKKSLAVVYLDLDGFKTVNDSWGHVVGDQLLVSLAARMSAVLRDGDTMARLGGDEFVAVLLDLADPADCESVLERLLLAASGEVQIDDGVLQVSASIGVTVYPQDGVDADQLMRHADQAMYQAKRRGKNCFQMFDVDQDAALHAHHESLERFRTALKRRELVLHYQPKVNLRNAQVQGFEALIRWQHPERGLLGPGEFLPAVRHTDAMIELDYYVVELALAQIQEWVGLGHRWRVAVNITPEHLMASDFSDWLQAALQRYPQVPRNSLELEIVETAALDDVQRVAKVIEVCHAMGVSFAIDDFGTGYSSLSYLKSLPADRIKIDRSFVHDMLDDANDMAVVHGVISLAQVFQREVIAEGVELPEHGVLLMHMGCNIAQGYGIAKPMPAANVIDWAANYRGDPSWAHWSQHAWEKEDLPLLLGQHDCEHWLEHLHRAQQGEQRTLPGGADLTAGAQRFAEWIEVRGKRCYGHLPAFTQLVGSYRVFQAQVQRWVSAPQEPSSEWLQVGLALQDLASRIAVFQEHCRALQPAQ